MQVLFYCHFLYILSFNKISFDKTSFNKILRNETTFYGLAFISICCSKVAEVGKSCPRLLVLQRVAQNAKSCSKVAEHNLFMATMQPFVNEA